MKLALIVPVWVVLLYAGSCQCNQALDAKIRMIWDRMDRNASDSRLEHYEMVQYFFNNNYTLMNGRIIYQSFDYEWGTTFGDPHSVTEYLFWKWNVADSPHELDVLDIQILANEIDSSDVNSLGYIDYFTEFHRYFEKAYQEGPGFGLRL